MFWSVSQLLLLLDVFHGSLLSSKADGAHTVKPDCPEVQPENTTLSSSPDWR